MYFVVAECTMSPYLVQSFHAILDEARAAEDMLHPDGNWDIFAVDGEMPDITEGTFKVDFAPGANGFQVDSRWFEMGEVTAL